MNYGPLSVKRCAARRLERITFFCSGPRQEFRTNREFPKVLTTAATSPLNLLFDEALACWLDAGTHVNPECQQLRATGDFRNLLYTSREWEAIEGVRVCARFQRPEIHTSLRKD